jgi:hypothetical protein
VLDFAFIRSQRLMADAAFLLLTYSHSSPLNAPDCSPKMGFLLEPIVDYANTGGCVLAIEVPVWHGAPGSAILSEPAEGITRLV